MQARALLHIAEVDLDLPVPWVRATAEVAFSHEAGPASVSVAHRITEPDRTITLYRFFGMVQISLVGILSLSIWTRYFRLGQS